MRKQSFLWTYTVLALILTIYGGYAVINSGNNFPVLGLTKYSKKSPILI